MDAKTYVAAALGLFISACGASRQQTETAQVPAQTTCPAECPMHGQGMQGQGMGTGMQGQGMQGQGMGPGMQGQGMQGQGMQGQGMQGQGMGPGAQACPFAMPEASVEAEETEEGPALSFTTTDPAKVEELRAHVNQMAAMHEQRRATGTPPPGWRGRPHSNMRAAEARVENTERGARLVFVPSAGADLDALRSEVESQASFAGGQCPMTSPRGS